MTKPGTINEQWGKTEEVSKTTSWERSFEQTFNTRFGQEFVLTALMERKAMLNGDATQAQD